MGGERVGKGKGDLSSYFHLLEGSFGVIRIELDRLFVNPVVFDPYEGAGGGKGVEFKILVLGVRENL